MRIRGSAPVVAGAVLLIVFVSGCSGQPSPGGGMPQPMSPPASGQPSSGQPHATAEEVSFVAVVDGDTIETSAGTVRIIGIDTPERGQCGHAESESAVLDVLAAGDLVRLDLPAGQNDQDRHGRLLRYVTTGSGVDLGLFQVESGHAVARYDSRDGYPPHPREESYHAAQSATLSPDGSVVSVGCQVAAPSSPPGKWWEQYSSCAKLKRNGAGHPTGPFSRDDAAQADAYDWFANRTGNAGDGDGDGRACE